MSSRTCPHCDDEVRPTQKEQWFICDSCGRELHALALGELSGELREVATGDGMAAKLARICLGD